MAERSHVSPWSTDPISWVTTAAIPLTATAVAVVYSVVDVTVVPPRGGALQWLGIVCLAAAGLVVHLRTRPPRGVLGAPEITAVLGLLTAAALCSAVDFRGAAFSLPLWWVPFGISLVLVAMAPYVRAGAIAALALALVVVVAVIAFTLVVPDDPSWPPVTTAIIVVTPVVAGGTVSAVLSGSIVRRLVRWSERPLPVAPAIGPEGIDDRALVRAVDDDISEQLSAAVTFLRTIAHSGEVTDEDAREARSLSLELRARLIADASATWLERVVRGHPVKLDDPDRLADRLSVSQRTALRAMIDALLAHPESGFVSARIALRASDSGDVAVAMRINTTLPEGRRVSFLAPYYVSLSATVRDIQWRDGASLNVEFEAQAETTTGRAPLVQRTPRTQASNDRD
ncbi:MAG: hypothetical protein ACXIUP_08500 [Microcella sp.]